MICSAIGGVICGEGIGCLRSRASIKPRSAKAERRTQRRRVKPLGNVPYGRESAEKEMFNDDHT